jgi:hypothetical protein|uniref:Uncharacterized protein n=1 Tax=viral metagenome TaxID=1070528 RepID=A0A6C0AI96_9ZZZZ
MNNKAYDYNGFIVSPSQPVKGLRTVKKILSIDSADRDTSKYYTNGDFVVYLPRQYQNVVGIRVMSGEFPPIKANTSPGALTHPSTAGPNTNATTYSGDTAITALTYYFLLDVEGLNYSDETVVGASRSTYRDGFLAKIPAVLNGSFIEYNDHSAQENKTRFSPALGTLDRLHIRVRTHAQQGNSGFMYWTSDGAYAASGNRTAEFTICLEIEMLENGFDDFSSFETRIHN